MVRQAATTSDVKAGLLSVKQVADALGMKEATIRLWIWQRKLPHVRCGRAVRVPASVVTQFIKQNFVPAKD
jgi:excisionase family DNA binding protein